MFMEIPKNIPLDPSMTMGPAAVKRVSRNGGGSAGGVNPKGSEGHPVTNGGKSEAAGRALLEMMANGTTPTNGFFRGKIEEKEPIQDQATIGTHAAAFLADGLEANEKFQKLMELASRGAESNLGKVSSREIELGRQALIPIDGKDGQLAAALRHAFNSADRQGTITKEAIINSFHANNE
jgi:hypothetical protein